MIELLLAKIHRAVVTEANINYEGSITISSNLLRLVGLYEYQKVQVVDINNGNRFETYIIQTDKKNTICLNGAAARMVTVGDRIIIMAYQFIDRVPENYMPNIIRLDENNEVI